jgi:hypothetical protein
LARWGSGRYAPVEDERTDLEQMGTPDHGGRTSGDPDERTVPPGEEPQASEGPGTTAAEQRQGRDLDGRLDQEEPDEVLDRRERARRLREEGTGLTDQEKDLVAEEAEEVSRGSAEEDAIRVEEEPPGGTGGPDRYVEGEPDGR